jgi:hypothetical protein
MDNTVQQLITAAKKISAELRTIAQGFASLHVDLQENTHAIFQAREASDEHAKNPPVLRAELQVPESVIREARAAYADAYTHHAGALEKLKTKAGILATAAIIVYVFLSILQLTALHRVSSILEKAAIAGNQNYAGNSALHNLTEQLHREQRAWVSVGDVRGVPAAGSVWDVVATFRNSGRSFAKNLKGATASDLVARNAQPNFAYEKVRKFNGSLISPNTDYHLRLVTTRSKGSGRAFPLTEQQLESLNKGNLRLYTHGQATYDDVFGRHHWLTFCYFWVPETRAFSPCTEHNDTDND